MKRFIAALAIALLFTVASEAQADQIDAAAFDGVQLAQADTAAAQTPFAADKAAATTTAARQVTTGPSAAQRDAGWQLVLMSVVLVLICTVVIWRIARTRQADADDAASGDPTPQPRPATPMPAGE